MHSALDLTALKLPITITINHRMSCLLSTSLMLCFVQIKCVNAGIDKNESREILARSFYAAAEAEHLKGTFFSHDIFCREQF